MTPAPGKWLLALIFVAVCLAATGRAEEAEPDADEAGRVAAERYAAEYERALAELKGVVDAAARKIIESQPDERSAGDAALVIGIFHHIGLLHGVDLLRASEYMEIARKKDVPEAGATMAALCLDLLGDDGEPDPDRVATALAYLEPAADADSPDALRLLGILYGDGAEGLEADPEKSERYFLAAARHGDAESLRRLEAFFERARVRKAEHPDEYGELPASAEEVVVPELVEASARRSEELNRIAEKVGKALDELVLSAMGGESERKAD